MADNNTTRSTGKQQPTTTETKAHSESAAPTHPRASQRRLVDLLREVENVHSRLSEFYGRLGERAQRPKSKLLLEFMREHELTVQHCIHEFESHSDSEVLESWFKYTPEIEPERWISEIDFKPDMTDEEIAEIVARMDNYLTDTFAQLAERSVPQRLREAVDNFLQLEQRAKIRALRAANDT